MSVANAAGVGTLPAPGQFVQPASGPAGQRVRAYFAPVDRSNGTPTYFDAAQAALFSLNAPPAPWVDLGWVEGFTRTSGSSFSPVLAGSPPVAQSQLRQELAATVSLRFVSWGKLQMALATGSEQMNLLAEQTGAPPQPSGGPAVAAVKTAAGCTAASLVLVAPAFAAGDLIAVDSDYSGQTGYVGSGASGAYVQSAAQVNSDVDYVRRATLNVAKVTSVSGNTVTLSSPLLAGAPAAGMGVQQIVALMDREGGTFFQEWSALFAISGQQGETVFYHYPRLQTMRGASETLADLRAPLFQILLNAQFRALPVTDARDGAAVVCFRSFVPAPMMAIG